jgi:predicted NAD/FAD-binding protein
MNKTKIAVVGSGISGLTCAYLLSKDYEVHLFESESRLGGHTHTHDIETKSGKYKIDTGFIVCNDRNYPNFMKLLDKIGLETQPSFMSFSVKSPKDNVEYNGTSLNALFCQRLNLIRPRFYRMIYDIIRFNKEATRYYLEHKNQTHVEITLEEYLEKNNYSTEFTEHYIMPMGAAIWSASREEMRSFPLHFFVRFFHHHGMLTVDQRPQWRVLKGGSSSYISKLTENFAQNIHLNSEVISVSRNANGVSLKTQGAEFTFDHVILACHADQAKAILKDPSEEEASVMNGFSYRPNNILLHTDESILPKSKLGHASWNYYIPKEVKNHVAVTYHMNILQSIKAPESFLVSLNMDEFIDPKKVLKKISYSHPVYNFNAVKSQSLWSTVSGKNKVHFCGAYWGNGFHEDGVKSALQVTAMFGINL